MQLPLIKDGVVVNIVELNEGTICVDKATHQRMTIEEDADYSRRANDWRASIAAHGEAIRQAEIQLLMVTGTAATVKAKAREQAGDAAVTLERVLLADAEVEAWTAKVADMKIRPAPSKPVLIRIDRWIYPDSHTVGPSGGNIGDYYDGRIYVAPVDKSAA